jgi:hypothetical protein
VKVTTPAGADIPKCGREVDRRRHPRKWMGNGLKKDGK